MHNTALSYRPEPGRRKPDLESSLEARFCAFRDYARSFATGEANHDFHLELKITHTEGVLAYTRHIAGAEEVFFFPPLRRAVLLAALYHDFGRFPQYARYRTFSDSKSEDHARLSLREVNRLKLLEGEDMHVRGLVRAGVLLHNRFALPDSLTREAALVARAVRDADKLDIMRIMAGHLTGKGPIDPVIALHVADSPRISPAVLAAVLARRMVAYADLATTTDFKLLICGWLYELNYAASRAIAAQEEYLASLLASLPPTEELKLYTISFAEELARAR